LDGPQLRIIFPFLMVREGKNKRICDMQKICYIQISIWNGYFGIWPHPLTCRLSMDTFFTLQQQSWVVDQGECGSQVYNVCSLVFAGKTCWPLDWNCILHLFWVPLPMLILRNYFKDRYLWHPNSVYVLCFVFLKSTP
jgi:hypothetical protein